MAFEERARSTKNKKMGSIGACCVVSVMCSQEIPISCISGARLHLEPQVLEKFKFRTFGSWLHSRRSG